MQNDGPVLDDLDRRIVEELNTDARVANNALADRVGIAASTCLSRVRALRERGVIRGFYADVDMAALGRPLEAMISVRLSSGARGHLSGFAEKMAALPAVRNVFFLGGADDFLVQVATTGTDDLRDFVVDNLSGDPDVASTVTSVIFSHVRGQAGRLTGAGAEVSPRRTGTGTRPDPNRARGRPGA